MQRRRIWIAGGGVALAVVLVATGWALRSGDEAPQPPVAVGTAPTATPSAAASPSDTRPAPTVPPLVPFPDNVVMIVGHAGYRHGGGSAYYEVTRHYRERTGALHSDVIWKQSETVNLTGMVANERGELFATSCLNETCGFDGPSKPGVETVVTRSTDGGMTWREIGRKPGKWWATVATDGLVLAVNFDGQARQYASFPGGAAVVPPRPATDESLPIIFRGQLAWVAEMQIVSSRGESLYGFELPGYPNVRVQSVLARRRGGPSATGDSFPLIFASWSTEGLPGRLQFFVGMFLPPIGLPLKVVKIDGEAPRLAAILHERDLLVTADYVRPGTCTAEATTGGADPAIMRYPLEPLYFIGTPFYDKDCSRGSQLVISAQPMPTWARVKGEGDCVNLRRDPSLAEPVLDCLGDGAIVNLREPRSSDGTRSWQSVVGPSGQEGWIAAEFLEE